MRGIFSIIIIVAVLSTGTSFAAVQNFDDDVILQPAKKLFLGGDTDTYIYESAPNTIDFVVGDNVIIRADAGRIRSQTGGFVIDSGEKFIFDGSGVGDTSIRESIGNRLTFEAGGVDVLNIDSNSLNIGSLTLKTTKSKYFDSASWFGTKFPTITSSDPNARSGLQIAPTGTSNLAQLDIFGTSDIATNPEMLEILATGNEFLIFSDKRGTGTLRPIKILMDTAPIITFNTDNTMDFNSRDVNAVGDFKIIALKKIFLDGGTNDYLTSSGDVISIFAAGNEIIKIGVDVDILTADLKMNSGDILMGSGDVNTEGGNLVLDGGDISSTQDICIGTCP